MDKSQTIVYHTKIGYQGGHICPCITASYGMLSLANVQHSDGRSKPTIMEIEEHELCRQK